MRRSHTRDQREPRPLVRVGLCAVWMFVLAGCVPSAYVARTEARRMLDDASTPRVQLASQQRLVEMGDHADPYLPGAFLPIGLYDVPAGALKQIAKADFNVVVNGDKDSAKFLSGCKSLGIRLIPYVNLEKLDADLEKSRDEESIWSWYLFDEPDLNKRTPEFIGAHFARLRKADPNRPIYLTVWSPKRYQEFAEFCDIFAVNPYPIISVDPKGNQLRHVGFALDKARSVAGSKPVWAVIQAFWAKPHWPRNPTPAELRAMVYLAINHSAKGIIYFSYKSGGRPITQHKRLFAMIRRVNSELRSFKGALLKDPIPDSVSSDLIATGRPGIIIGKPIFSPVDCSLRKFGDHWMLIAVNPDPERKTVEIELRDLEELGGRATEVFAGDAEQKPLKLDKSRRLRLDFDAFQVRVFLVD